MIEDRRGFIRKAGIGLGAAWAAPVVLSTPAFAAGSCAPSNTSFLVNPGSGASTALPPCIEGRTGNVSPSNYPLVKVLPSYTAAVGYPISCRVPYFGPVAGLPNPKFIEFRFSNLATHTQATISFDLAWAQPPNFGWEDTDPIQALVDGNLLGPADLLTIPPDPTNGCKTITLPVVAHSAAKLTLTIQAFSTQATEEFGVRNVSLTVS